MVILVNREVFLGGRRCEGWVSERRPGQFQQSEKGNFRADRGDSMPHSVRGKVFISPSGKVRGLVKKGSTIERPLWQQRNSGMAV